MELAKGEIAGIKVIFGVTVVTGSVNYYLQALDTGRGTISMEEFDKRMLNINGRLLEDILEARGKNLDLIKFISSKTEVLSWLEEIRPILIQGDGRGQIRVEWKYPENTPAIEPVKGLDLPPGMNTLTLPELEDAFHRVITANNGKMYDGIRSGHIKLEDSLPWFEIAFKEKASVKKAKQFCQQLADEMNIRILFNRIEGGSKEYSVLGVMDIDYEEVEKGCNVVPALSRDGNWAEFMEDYGTQVLPSHANKKTTKKLKM